MDDPDTSMSFLNDLNPAQLQAVKAVDGPVMIIAGAGSGKTRALTYRVAYLISLGVRPYQILALTFTNKAANEMKSRIADLVGPKSQDVWMGTFHSTFARILRIEAEKIGFGRNFTIYDTDDSLNAIRNVLTSLGFSHQQFNPIAIRARISRAKNQMISPSEYQRAAADLFEEKASQVYEEYEKSLRASNAMDFDDLLVKPIELFERDAQTLEKYQQRFKYVLVDEYQDTNRAQYHLIKMLAGRRRNLCVVGDDAQSIYAFRGADIRNILDFERDYPDCKIFRLEQNYRSTKTILEAADRIIMNNRYQIEKNLWTENPTGDVITVLECEDEKDEGYQIAEKIRQLSLTLKIDLKDFAVLYRTNAQSRALEDALRRSGIAYTIVGGVEFYRRKEIKDVLAYLRIIVNPRDDEPLLRIINYPARGIGETTVKKLRTLAAKHGLSLIEVLQKADSLVDSTNASYLSARTRQQIRDFTAFLSKYLKLRGRISASELARALVDDLGILEEFKAEGTPESLSRRENVLELLSAITEFSSERPEGTLANFLEEVSLISDVDTWNDERNAVTLMTLHSAKGLEFPVVFITGLEEGLFPLSSSETDHMELEEERRLFYVGVTRTMRKLFISYTRSRVRYGEVTFPVPSRFVDEIPEDLLRVERTGTQRRERGGSPVRTTSSVRYSRMDGEGKEFIPSIELDFHKARSEAHDDLASSKSPSEKSLGKDKLGVGSIVEHEIFGRGQVVVLSGKGDLTKAIVEFDSYGKKHLLLRYANLKVV